MIDGAVIVQERNARIFPELGLSSDARELATPITAGRDDEHWLATAKFDGVARLLEGEVLGHTPLPVSTSGFVAMVTSGGFLSGIVAPDPPAEPSVWFRMSIASLSVRPSGSAGLFRKRPDRVEVTRSDVQLDLSMIGKLYIHSMRRQAGQEGAFCAALGVEV